MIILNESAGAIKAIYSGIDFTKDGINEIVIGRDTGSLEVYGFDQQQPILIFQVSLEESISTIDGGFITSPNAQVRAAPFGTPDAQTRAMAFHVKCMPMLHLAMHTYVPCGVLYDTSSIQGLAMHFLSACIHSYPMYSLYVQT